MSFCMDTNIEEAHNNTSLIQKQQVKPESSADDEIRSPLTS